MEEQRVLCTIRSAVPADYPALPPFLDRAFGCTPGTFATTYSREWAEQNVDWQRTYVVDDGGQVVSLVRVYPMHLVQAGFSVLAGGIGCVSTAEEARGRGHMTALLHHACAAMRAEGMAISVLWGDRHRYGPFGYEGAGRTIRLGIRLRGLRRCGVAPIDGTSGQDDPALLRRVEALYDAARYRLVRSREQHAAAYGVPGATVLGAGDGRRFGYLVLLDRDGATSAAEFGGYPDMVLGVARHAMEARGIETVELLLPADVPIAAHFVRAASWWSVVPSAMAAVVDLDRALSAFGLQGERPRLQAMAPQAQTRSLFGGPEPGLRNLFIPHLDGV